MKEGHTLTINIVEEDKPETEIYYTEATTISGGFQCKGCARNYKSLYESIKNHLDTFQAKECSLNVSLQSIVNELIRVTELEESKDNFYDIGKKRLEKIADNLSVEGYHTWIKYL